MPWNLAPHLLENWPVGRAFTVEASFLVSRENIPDDDRLWVVLSVHKRAECDNISAKTEYIKNV